MAKLPFFLPLHDLLHAKGRVSRLQYLVYGLTYGVCFAVAFWGILVAVATMPKLLASILLVGCFAAFSYFGTCMNIKRLHDIGWPGIWVLIFLIDMPLVIFQVIGDIYDYHNATVDQIESVLDPILKIANFGISLFIVFKRGTKGDNKYGPDPLAPPTPAVDVF